METAAAAYFAFDPDAAAVFFDEAAGDGEAEAGAAGGAAAGLVDAIEALEEARDVLERDADAEVFDGELYEARTGVAGCGDEDAGGVVAAAAVLGGVLDEVDDKGGMKPELTTDGFVHPNAAGYEVMTPIAEAAIAKAMKQPAPKPID